MKNLIQMAMSNLEAWILHEQNPMFQELYLENYTELMRKLHRA